MTSFSCALPGSTYVVQLLPMTATTTPIAATTKQQHQNNNDEDQFHSKSPLR
jgi:hypothetical protein